ncbi:MAG: 6-carboxytetrahydropterin synthase QueD [Candidatus Omnitrophica bacterium]|jgi:6-pyruvoyltetrahydropterin/6-carboxytetrahydropterin synthase|nr:6-carboxytetrahydropterin synthase QueD [Candidatus Omnitrophota bacterium]MDD5079703.1 6-carboxytetrahydropterin synthase QueD [Candidatus Omnitrophota bacterium]
MYKVKVEGVFSSAHNLRGYKGKCEDLHGHNWRVEAVVSGDKLDKIGMLMDFKLLKERLNFLLETLDHKYLNKQKPFNKTNPTSENIARYIYDRLKLKVRDLRAVTVWENNTSCATYEE